MRKLIVITGASGSGKSAAVECLRQKFSQAQRKVDFLHFDSIGVPSQEEMVRDFGSQEGWQRAKTLEWIAHIKETSSKNACVIIEGQMRIAYLKEALHKNHLQFAQIILLDCSDEMRQERLCLLRNQPELADKNMMLWADYLRKEAKNEVVCIIDTTMLSKKKTVDQIIAKSGLGSFLENNEPCVQVVAYDPNWPKLFHEEGERIKKALGENCAHVHHFGSTSIPGLDAKPIIDILAFVKSLKKLNSKCLEDVGFLTRGEVIPTGRYFKKKDPSIHLHIFEENNPMAIQNLKFRDWLRAHPEDCTAYASLKKKLAAQYPKNNDMAYCKAKTDFIHRIWQKCEGK